MSSVMRKGLIAAGVLVAVGGVTAVLYSKSNSQKDKGFKTVAVTRGPVVEKALAVGAIRPQARDRGQEQDLGHREDVVPRGRRPSCGPAIRSSRSCPTRRRWS